MMLTPLDVAPFQPTEKLPGHKVLTSRRCHVIGENGGVLPTQDYHADPHLAVQKSLPWWLYALIGAGMALVVMLARGW